MPNVFLKPARDADNNPMVVPDPGNHQPLKPAGEWKEHTTYWARRIRDKDVEECEPPKEETAEAEAELAPLPAPDPEPVDADAGDDLAQRLTLR